MPNWLHLTRKVPTVQPIRCAMSVALAPFLTQGVIRLVTADVNTRGLPIHWMLRPTDAPW